MYGNSNSHWLLINLWELHWANGNPTLNHLKYHSQWNSLQKGRESICRLGMIRSWMVDLSKRWMINIYTRYQEGGETSARLYIRESATAQSVTKTSSAASSWCSFVLTSKSINGREDCRVGHFYIQYHTILSLGHGYPSLTYPRRKSMMATSVVTPRALSSRATSRGGIRWHHHTHLIEWYGGCLIGGFHKWRYSSILMGFSFIDNLYTPSILGYPHLWKPPYVYTYSDMFLPYLHVLASRE